jgi:hypothetical protein
MIKLLLGGSSDSFKTITHQDALDIKKRFFHDTATQDALQTFFGGDNDRTESLAKIIDLVQGEVFADSTAMIGATRFDKKFTTSLLSQSNSELLQEVGRMQQMHIRGLESRTGKNVLDLLRQLRKNDYLTEQEVVELTGLAGTKDYKKITSLSPNRISKTLDPLVAMSAEKFTEYIKTRPGLRRKRLHIERCP